MPAGCCCCHACSAFALRPALNQFYYVACAQVEQLEFLRLQHQRDGHPRDRFGPGSTAASASSVLTFRCQIRSSATLVLVYTRFEILA